MHWEQGLLKWNQLGTKWSGELISASFSIFEFSKSLQGIFKTLIAGCSTECGSENSLLSFHSR